MSAVERTNFVVGVYHTVHLMLSWHRYTLKRNTHLMEGCKKAKKITTGRMEKTKGQRSKKHTHKTRSEKTLLLKCSHTTAATKKG